MASAGIKFNDEENDPNKGETCETDTKMRENDSNVNKMDKPKNDVPKNEWEVIANDADKPEAGVTCIRVLEESRHDFLLNETGEDNTTEVNDWQNNAESKYETEMNYADHQRDKMPKSDLEPIIYDADESEAEKTHHDVSSKLRYDYKINKVQEDVPITDKDYENNLEERKNVMKMYEMSNPIDEMPKHDMRLAAIHTDKYMDKLWGNSKLNGNEEEENCDNDADNSKADSEMQEENNPNNEIRKSGLIATGTDESHDSKLNVTEENKSASEKILEYYERMLKNNSRNDEENKTYNDSPKNDRSPIAVSKDEQKAEMASNSGANEFGYYSKYGKLAEDGLSVVKNFENHPETGENDSEANEVEPKDGTDDQNVMIAYESCTKMIDISFEILSMWDVFKGCCCRNRGFWSQCGCPEESKHDDMINKVAEFFSYPKVTKNNLKMYENGKPNDDMPKHDLRLVADKTDAKVICGKDTDKLGCNSKLDGKEKNEAAEGRNLYNDAEMGKNDWEMNEKYNPKDEMHKNGLMAIQTDKPNDSKLSETGESKLAVGNILESGEMREKNSKNDEDDKPNDEWITEDWDLFYIDIYKPKSKVNYKNVADEFGYYSKQGETTKEGLGIVKNLQSLTETNKNDLEGDEVELRDGTENEKDTISDESSSDDDDSDDRSTAKMIDDYFEFDSAWEEFNWPKADFQSDYGNSSYSKIASDEESDEEELVPPDSATKRDIGDLSKCAFCNRCTGARPKRKFSDDTSGYEEL